MILTQLKAFLSQNFLSFASTKKKKKKKKRKKKKSALLMKFDEKK